MPNFGTLPTNFGTKCYLLDKLKIPLGQVPQFETHSCHFWPKKCPTLGHQKNFGTEFLQSGHNKKTLGHAPQFETHKKPLGPTGSYLGHNLTNNWDTKP